MIHEGVCKGTDWTVDDIPDLTGKVALVTGGNTGKYFATSMLFPLPHLQYDYSPSV